MKVVKNNINNLVEFRGLKRLTRPPVFAWSKMSHKELKKRKLSASSQENESKVSYFMERV